MAEYEDEEDEDELPSVDHGPFNEGPWEKRATVRYIKTETCCGLLINLSVLNT